ncbi:hypothetical protein V8D89_004679 [Ganoderma adspersum]
MGVNGLWKEIHNVSVTTKLETLSIAEGFQGKRSGRMFCVGVDVSIWMRQLQQTFAVGHAQSGENPELHTFFYHLSFLSQYPIHAVFVVDGPLRPKVKRSTQVKTMPHWMTTGMQDFALAFGFAWIKAAAEAEAELANMNDLGVIDAILTDDGDALHFGAAAVIRNPSFKCNAGPTYVDVYRASTILHDKGMSRGDLIFFALLVGNDYDPNGLPRCGARTARGLIQYGLGRSLYAAMLVYEDDDPKLVNFLCQWHTRLQLNLEQDPCGFIGRTHPALAATVPASFPKLDVLGLLMFPTVLKCEYYESVNESCLLNVAHIGALCEQYFTFGNATSIMTTLRKNLWGAEVVRMLVKEGLQPATRCLLDITLVKVDEPPATGFATCHLRVSDADFNQAATDSLRGIRDYLSRAKKTEEDDRKEVFRSLVVHVPAVIIEHARPMLVNPTFHEVGYMYGRVHKPLASGKPVYMVHPGSAVIPDSLEPVLPPVAGPSKATASEIIDLTDGA